ncbi:hypothetical protein N510_002715 [Firmicutes bacterium ASF500]|nr:hypothetical protein N510_002715 [Firmicutes bacterium ASF500]
MFAGPNGSGKSTFTEILRPKGIPYINADDIQRALGCENLEVPKLVPVCDMCHIYDNSDMAYRIFKKRKDLCWYSPPEGFWLKKDISALTGIKNARRAALNK